MTAATGDIPPEEFRALLHRAADWIADYRAGIGGRPVASSVRPGEISAGLPQTAPENGEALGDIFADVERVIMPGILHWGHPSFLGYFGSTTTAAGILAEAVAATLNVSAMTWRTSPIATELETLVLNWLREMLDLPSLFRGIVYDTASISTLHALAAARQEAIPHARDTGLSGAPRLRIYTSDQGHSHIDKAAITLGLGEANVRRVATDHDFRMDVSALRAAMAEDAAAGIRPLAVVATVGTTSTTSVDPLPEIAAVCREHGGVWLHVDAAYGGALAILPEGRWVFDGIEHADSVVINPHKWLFVPLDFSALYVRAPEKLRRVFQLVPEYLEGDAAAAGDAEINYMDYGLQLGRRFRALKAWFVWRAFGREGLQARIREHCRLAQLFAAWVQSEPRFELLAPVPMGVVCFRFIAPDANRVNRDIVGAVNASGQAYLTHTTLRGTVAIRLGLGNVLTTEAHLRAAWELIKNEASLRQ